MLDLLVIGSIAIDHIFRVTHIPEKHFEAKILQSTISFGGRASNVATIASKLGLNVGLVSPVGDDFVTLGYQDYITKLGVDQSGIRVVPGRNSVQVYIFIDKEGNQITFCQSDIVEEWKKMQVPVDLIERSRMVHLTTSGSFRFNAACARVGLEKMVRVSLDPGNDPVSTDPEYFHLILPWTEILFMNNFELDKCLTTLGLGQPTSLHAFGPKVVVSMGGSHKDHVTIYRDSGLIKVMQPEAEGRNPVGASDAFVAGFLVALLRGLDLEDCCMVGCVVSSLIVRETTIHSNLPTWERVIQELLRTYGRKIHHKEGGE